MINHQPDIVREENPGEQTHRTRFQKGVIFTGTGSMITIISLFLETMISVRILTTESYGIYVLIIAIVNFFVTVVDFGCKAAVTQFIASSDHDRKAALAHSTLIFRLVVLVLISILIWLVRGWMFFLDPSGELINYTAYIPIMLAVASLDELLQAVHQGFHSFKHMAVSQIVRGLFRLLLSIIFLVVFKSSVVALIFSWVFSFALSVVYLYLALPIPKRIVWQQSLLGGILRFGLPLQLDRLLWYLSNRFHVFLLSFFTGPTGVAIFNIAAMIPTALVRLRESFLAVFYPTMAASLAGGDNRQAAWMLDHSVRLCSFIGTLGALGAVLFSREIITLIFPDKYSSSSLAFALLMIAFHMTFLFSVMGYTLTAAGFPKRSLGQNTMRVISTIAGDLLLIPGMGFLGSAIASVASSYLTNPVSVWLLKKSNIPLTVTSYIKQTMLLWLCVALFWWVQPGGLIFKLVIFILFIVINIALSTVSYEDISLILPNAVTWRLHSLKRMLTQDR